MRQRDARDGVDATLRQILPGPLDLRKGHARSPEEVREPVEAVAQGMAAAKSTSQRCEHDPVLSIDGIDRAMADAIGDLMLDAIMPADVERFLDGLLKDRVLATRNRYRTLLHAMLNRAKRHGRITSNPVQGVGKFRESEGRVLHLTLDEEAAVREALSPEAMETGRPSLDKDRPDLRPLFTVSVHTGLRWSEQRALRWADADFLTGLITVRHSKTGYARQVPMNSVVRSQLMDLAGQRERPADPQEPVFRCRHQQPDKFFPAAVARARAALLKAGKDMAWLEG